MNPCSLPGMTQGARKRAARRDSVVNDQDGNAIEMPCPICCYWDPCDGSGVLPAKGRK